MTGVDNISDILVGLRSLEYKNIRPDQQERKIKTGKKMTIRYMTQLTSSMTNFGDATRIEIPF